MKVISTTRTLLAGAAVAVAGAAMAVALPAAAAPTSHPTTKVRPVVAGSNYLALGDSIAFGFREAANKPTPDYSKASNFVGYPERVGQSLGLTVANAACPGESSASFNNVKARSYACETDAAGTGPGYRSVYPLHETYAGSQLKYGVHYLRTHKNTRLVTLQLGANDGFLCQKQTSDKCMSVSEITALEARIEKNVGRALKTIRTYYTGQIVIVNYYSMDYTNALMNLQSQVLNNALDTGANGYHVTIANGYQAFKTASAQAGGDTCAAGLLTTLSTGGCGVHPSVAGQQVLAGAIEHVVKK